jgi:hypothetical protein
MATTPEGKVKEQVKRLLKKYGCYQFWPVQVGYGAATLDCLGCYNGKFFAVETKAPGKRLTPRQSLTRKDMQDANGVVFVVGELLHKKGDTVRDRLTLTTHLCEKDSYSGMVELETWLILTAP